MTIEHRVGDLFEQSDLKAIAHGVNCQGKMGAGIALRFKLLYPDMFKQYAELCELGVLSLGMNFTWAGHDGRVIFNLASQYDPGPHASLDAIRTSLWDASWTAVCADIFKIGLPKIGAGIGGLDWVDVEAVIKEVALDFPEITYVIVYLP